MPLTISPIDGQPMRQITRFGIEFDVCPTTGGVWLDKGELEKLIAFVKAETEAEQQTYAPPPAEQRYAPQPEQRYAPRPDERARYRDHDDDDDHYDRRKYPHGKKKNRLLDLFDFD